MTGRDAPWGGAFRRLLVLFVVIATLSTATISEARAEHRRTQPRLLASIDREVLTVRPDGLDRRTVAQGGPVYDATWGPGGKRIAYAMAWCATGCRGLADAWVAELHVVDDRGANDHVVFRLPAGYMWNLSWSPDGQWIAFIASTPSLCWGCPPAWDVRVLNLATGAQLTFGPANEVAWAPDSRRLALVHAGAIHVVDVVAGAVPTRVTATHLLAGAPVWSPDGRHLAFLGQRRAEDVSTARFLWVAAPDGSDARRFDTRSWSRPSWSPSGRSIATTTARSDGIEVTSLESGARRRLATPRPGWVYAVAWAPDGGTIAYLHEGRDWRYRFIRTVRPDGSRDQQILVHSGWIGSLAWSG